MAVSVIMAAYNRQDYVGAAIESVLRQDYADFELIVVDDCSTDGTAAVVDSFARRDQRVRLVRQPRNQGVAHAANTGLALARYDLIARLDDDDEMLPHRLRRQVEFMAINPQASVVSAWATLIDEAGRTIGQSCPVVDQERGVAERDPSLFLEILNPAAMFRKQAVIAVGGYRPVLLEDRDLWGRMVTAGHRIYVQPEILVRHRRHGGSLMTSRLNEMFEAGDFIDFNVVRRLDGKPELTLDEYRSHIASLAPWQQLANGRRRSSQIAFRRATVHFSKRHWRGVLGNLMVAMLLQPVATGRRLVEKAAVR